MSAWGPLLSGRGRGPSSVVREMIHVLHPDKCGLGLTGVTETGDFFQSVFSGVWARPRQVGVPG